MCTVWRYPIHEMTELPDVQDLYFDGIGAFEIIGDNVRLIPFKLVPGQEVRRVTIGHAFVRPLLGLAESLNSAQSMLLAMPVPKPGYDLIKRLGH